ncbi:SDR family NAD(P)-dependent oxidoreductase [Actinomadura rayongensis]|uniref:SDR family oxidoreductase n=1 Tax=Actinomadura rayongensis TaxID=1429076 RepID=A0A6I4W8Q3_9ACTN|nr:SDR family oxidoreductase [Actinomadura rayongensis]MXQ66527.1 SDR family oxidoreductase [Actinomadura rayongensis]
MSTAAPIPVRSPLPSGLSGATALLIGGTSGIGLAAGVLLRSVGARVVLVGRDPSRLDAAVARVRAASPDTAPDDVLGVAGDAGSEQTITEAFDRAGRVDHVLLTAGGISGMGLAAELSDDAITVNLDGRVRTAFTVARAAATRLPAGGSLTFSSGALVISPRPGMSALVAAAGAVEAVTRALAVEFAPARQRVNAVRYGRVDTPLLRAAPGLDTDEAMAAAGAPTPLGRFGTAEEAAASALFLMANNYVTGQVITVDGGEFLT